MKLRDVKLHPRNILLSAALLTAAPLCLTGCINDDEPWEEEEKFELTEGTEYYIGVDINVPSATDLGEQESRADTELGEYTESAISSMLFLFYNKNGAIVGASKVDVVNKWPNTTYRLTVPVKVLPGQAVEDATPVQIVAIANPPFNYDDYLCSLKSLTDLKLKYSDVRKSTQGGPRFMMSSSVYYANGNIRIAVPVSRSDFHTQQAEAESASDPVEIDLERAVARVDMRLRPHWDSSEGNNTIFYWNENGGVNANAQSARLGLTIFNWDISGKEDETYLIKNFRAPDFSNSPMTFAQANAGFGGLTDPAWNDPDNRRSYWACSPSYYNEQGLEFFNATSKLNECRLAYCQPGSELPLEEAYFLESTTSLDALGRSNMSAVPTAIVIGQYEAGGYTQVDKYDAGKPDFYLRRWERRHASPMNFYYPTDEQMIKAFLTANDGFIYTLNVGNTGIGWSPINKDFYRRDLFEIINCSYMHLSSNYVTLQLRTDSKPEEARLCLKVSDTGNNSEDFVFISSNPDRSNNQISISEANKLIANYYAETDMKYVEKFTRGLTYFAIPIKHLWEGENDIEDTGWTPMVGQYGLVRNHHYTIEVTGVNGIGHAIANPDGLIKPNIKDLYPGRGASACPAEGRLNATVTAKSL